MPPMMRPISRRPGGRALGLHRRLELGQALAAHLRPDIHQRAAFRDRDLRQQVDRGATLQQALPIARIDQCGLFRREAELPHRAGRVGGEGIPAGHAW